MVQSGMLLQTVRVLKQRIFARRRVDPQTILEERPQDRQTDEWCVDTVTVEAEETVTEPAGTFKAFKIVRRNKRTGIVRYELWYSLQLKQWVKMRENLDSGLRTRELVSFKLG
jgi:hypothetical protein